MEDIAKSTQLATKRNTLEPAQAWEAMVGESRVNWIRMGAIALFYFQHWILFSRIEAPTQADLSYNALASTVVILWGVFAALMQILLIKKPAPWVSYLATFIDLVLVTLLIISSPVGGPHSALLVLYFVVLGASALRFSLPLIYFTTTWAILLYLLVLAQYGFVVVGYERYYSPEFAAERIPGTTCVIFVLSLLTTGVIAGQVVRQARRLALVACARVESDLRPVQNDTSDPAEDEQSVGESDFELDLGEDGA